VWGSGPDDVWAVQTQPAAVVHFDGACWIVAHEGDTATDFSDVSVAAPNDVWVVGSAGFVHFDGTTWTTTPPLIADAPPMHVKAFAPDDVWADSARRWVFHYDGHAWQIAATGELPQPGKTSGYGPFIAQIAGDATVRHPYFLIQGELGPDSGVAELGADGTLHRLPKLQTATAYLGLAVAGKNIWLVGLHGAIEHATFP